MKSLLTALALLTCLAPDPARACRLALALGFDVSRSVDAADYRVQTDGIVAALHDPRVRDLILVPAQPVAMAIYEWSGPREMSLVADWALLETAADIDQMALAVLTHQRQAIGLTAVGDAVAYGGDLLARAPDCLWQTIDISGDGMTNRGPQPRQVYAEGGFEGITVNGLAIGGHEASILSWFERNVRHGPGAFVEFAPYHTDFPRIFLRKLIRELQPPIYGQAASSPDSPRAISALDSSIP
jgi:hypothetical protein